VAEIIAQAEQQREMMSDCAIQNVKFGERHPAKQRAQDEEHAAKNKHEGMHAALTEATRAAALIAAREVAVVEQRQEQVAQRDHRNDTWRALNRQVSQLMLGSVTELETATATMTQFRDEYRAGVQKQQEDNEIIRQFVAQRGPPTDSETDKDKRCVRCSSFALSLRLLLLLSGWRASICAWRSSAI